MTEEHWPCSGRNEAVAAVEVHATSLEDIFIAYMQGNGDACEPAIAAKTSCRRLRRP